MSLIDQTQASKLCPCLLVTSAGLHHFVKTFWWTSMEMSGN